MNSTIDYEFNKAIKNGFVLNACQPHHLQLKLMI